MSNLSYQIQSTKNYSMFKLIGANRLIKQKNVMKLVKSFKLTKGMSKAIPIVVTKNYEVIDGQHRLEACKLMNTEVHYVISDDTKSSIPLFNAYQEKWGLDDYSKYYASQGNENYIKLTKIQEKVPLKTDAILNILGYPTSSTVNNLFKEGNFIFNEDINESIIKINDAIDFCFLVRGKRIINKKLLRALKYLERIKSFNKQELIEKIKEHPAKIYGCDTSEEYLDMLINIYNYRSRLNRIDEMRIASLKQEMKNKKIK